MKLIISHSNTEFKFQGTAQEITVGSKDISSWDYCYCVIFQVHTEKCNKITYNSVVIDHSIVDSRLKLVYALGISPTATHTTRLIKIFNLI